MNAHSAARPAWTILVVLYKQRPGAAVTCASLRRGAATLTTTDRVLLWDNSPEAAPDADLAELRAALPCAVEYAHHPENTPLPRVYNEATARAGEAAAVIFLDQDSSFGAAYFQTLEAAMAQHPDVSLFAPLVYAGERLVSPGEFRTFKGKFWRVPRTGLVEAGGTVALMSGLAVRTSFLQRFGGFDERLRLYGVDTNLLLRYAHTERHLCVMDTRIAHDLSDFNTESREVKARRFADFVRASRINASLLPPHARVLSALFLLYRRVRAALGR